MPLQARRILLVTLAILAVLYLLYLARSGLFPFIIGGLLAYLLAPVVRVIESVMPWRARWPGVARIVSIFIVYILAIALVIAFLATVIPPATRQTSDFIQRVPGFYDAARQTIEGLNADYTERVPENVRAQLQGVFQQIGDSVTNAARSMLTRTLGIVQRTLTVIVGLAILPFFLFYLLKDRELMTKSLYGMVHPSFHRHTRNLLAIADRTLGAYLRGQLLLGFIVGGAVFLGLLLMGIPFATVLGIIAGVTELVPVIGPIIGAIPGLLVALATSPSQFVWVLLLYVAVQQVENTLLVPRIQGNAVNLHPAVIMVTLIVGSQVAGIWGMIIAVPITGVAKEVFVYFHREWKSPPAPAGPPAQADSAPPAAE